MIVLVLATLALADVPPPEGYVESCTVANHQSDTVECQKCDAYHGGREPCEALEKQGYTRQCKTRGASVWDEVMCRPKGAASGDGAEDDKSDTPEGVTKVADSSGEGSDPGTTKARTTPTGGGAGSQPTQPVQPASDAPRCATAPVHAALPFALLGLLALRRRRS